MRVLDETDLAPEDIDHVVFVTSTGLATPTIDARLIGSMGFRPETMRTPLFGLGCAGGALGLVHAARILQGQPRQRLLLVNVELCGVTFQHRDFSKSNLVATALFGDGATAAVVVGGAVDVPGLEILETGTYLWRDTLDVMGWNFQDHGMQVVFSARIPRLVRDEMAGCLRAFLAQGGRGLGDVEHFLVHPGGTKVLGAYREALALDDRALDRSRRILAENGNCSAVTVMLVLEDFLRERSFAAGEIALVTALGPGFSAASVLLRCP